MSSLRLETATVVSHERVAGNMYQMWFSCPPLARGAAPGRFLMIHCTHDLDPLLPRPMSFHRFRDVPKGGAGGGTRTSPLEPRTSGPEGGAGSDRQFAILYDVRGRGTRWLSERKAGDSVTMFGPLGKGYELERDTRNVLLVAGGLGVAAVIALADEALAAGCNVTLLQGARTANLLFPHDLLPTDVEAVSATEDGSAGHRGRVTDLLPDRLPWADQVFACGPNPMFQSIANVVREARSRKPVQALLEERMGCGTGVCYGCAIFARKGVRLVCRDGPRFDLREVFA